MSAAKGRYEEFGTTPWTGIALAIVLAAAIGGSLLHPRSTATPAPLRAVPAAIGQHR